MSAPTRSSDETDLRSVLRALLRPPTRRRVIGGVAGVVLVGVGSWYVGMDAVHAATVAVGLAALGLCWVAVPDHRGADWPAEMSTASMGARRDVTQLSWSLRTRRGRVAQPALRRVRELAQSRLVHHHLDLANPDHRAGIESLIGSAAYATLQHSPNQRPPFQKSLVHCLDMLDRLDPSASGLVRLTPDQGTAASSTRTRTSTGTSTGTGTMVRAIRNMRTIRRSSRP